MSEKKPRGRPRGSGRRNQSTTFDSIVQLEATTESSQATAASTTQAQPDNISADQYSRPVTRNATAAAQLPTTVPASQSVSTRSGQSATSQSPGAATSKYLPGGGGRKQLTRKPVNPGRRSKEARYALAQEAFEREKEKRQEQANEALRAERARERLLRGRGRGDRARGRGRGGFMGDSHSVSGPFSGGKVTHGAIEVKPCSNLVTKYRLQTIAQKAQNLILRLMELLNLVHRTKETQPLRPRALSWG